MIRQGVRAFRDMYALTRDLGNLRVLLLSGMVSMVAAGFLNPVLPVYLQSRGLSLQGIGGVFSLGSLVPIFAQPVLGALSDRFGRKGFIIGLSLGTSLMLPVLAWVDSPAPLAAALALKLLLARTAVPVTSALAADNAPTRQRATVFALLDSINNLVFVAALVASAGVVGWLSGERVFLLAGALFLISSLVLFALREPERPRPSTTEGAAGALRLAFKGLAAPIDYVRRSPEYGNVFAFQFFFAFALNLFPIYVPLYATQLGLPQRWVGPMVAASWLVFAMVQPVGGRLSDGLTRRGGLICAGLAGMGVCSLGMGLAAWLPGSYALGLMVVAWALIAVPDGLSRPSLPALATELSPAAERGRFMGAIASCAALAQVLAPVCYGFLADRVSLNAAFLLSSGAFLLALISMARVREPSASLNPPLSSTTEPG